MNIKKLTALIGAAFVVAAPLTVAQATVSEINWSSNDTYTATLTVAPGKTVEACGQIDPKLPVQWKYEADSPLNFNIHRHSRDEVVYATKSIQSREDRGRFAPTFNFEWCWMWANESATDVSIRVDLKR
jgi:hypothetical protein